MSENNPNNSSADHKYIPTEYVQLQNADWIKNAVLYELNIRQFSEEGSFNAVQEQLPRLKDLGVDIIWLMPIHPIGKEKRKGSLGSYYSVQDFYAVSDEFGTENDLRSLIKAIHEIGMYVILDWVANHSSWDNDLATSHPEWYRKSDDDHFQPTRWRDYDDIIEFDYTQPQLRKYMTEAMKYWVREFEIDGFRCDVAAFVPLDFWENVRRELWQIRPVFMLAEAEDRDLHRNAFDATYNWTLWNILHEIAHGRRNAAYLAEAYLAEHVSIFPKAGIRLNFIDNHDKNAWEGTAQENFVDALQIATVFSFLMDGMPLIYSGQEAGLDRALKFFERDPIIWKPHPNEELYKILSSLKHRNQALWNGRWGAEMVRIKNDEMDHVLSFVRKKNKNRVIGIFNFSANEINFTCSIDKDAGRYQNVFTGSEIILKEEFYVTLAPWSFFVFEEII